MLILNLNLIKKKIILFIMAPLLLCIKNDYDLLYDWGQNNSVYISDKIGINYTNNNIKNYYVKDHIFSGETIMSIPKKVLLNIHSALKLCNSKLRSIYENYKKETLDNTNNIFEVKSTRIEHSFLAFLMTIVNKNKSNKNKFYNFFKYFFNTFESNLDKFPIFYTHEQIKIILFSLLGKGIMHAKSMVEEEYDTLRKIYKKEFDMDEYMKYRMFTFNKLVEINDVNYITPFIDILERNPINYNLNYSLTNENLDIVATDDINFGEELVVRMTQIPNVKSFITLGQIFEENKDYIDLFRIPIFSSNFLIQKNLDTSMSKSKIIDLNENDYYKQVLPAYIKLARSLNLEETKSSALKLFLENLQIIRNTYDKGRISILYEYFNKNSIVQKINSLLNSERNYLDKKIKELEKLINNINDNKNIEFDL